MLPYRRSPKRAFPSADPLFGPSFGKRSAGYAEPGLAPQPGETSGYGWAPVCPSPSERPLAGRQAGKGSRQAAAEPGLWLPLQEHGARTHPARRQRREASASHPTASNEASHRNRLLGAGAAEGAAEKDGYLKSNAVCEVNLICFQFCSISQHDRLPKMSSSGSG